MATEQAAYMDGTKTVIANSNGEYEVRSGGSRNLRNNNPGNIEYGPAAIAMGAVGSDGRFAIFPDMNTGNTAVEKLLSNQGYQNAPAVPSQGFNKGSIGAAIYRWAPPNENQSSSYAKFISERTGLDVNTPMSSLTPAQLSKVREAISVYEGSQKPYITYSKDPNIKEDFANFKTKAQNITAINKNNIKTKTNLGAYASFGSGKMADTTNLKAYIRNDSNFQPNMLDAYDNVAYRIKWWVLPEGELKNYESLTETEQAKYSNKKKKTLYDSATSTDYSIDNITIKSVLSANGRTRKVFPLEITFDVTEPNGCAFLDELKWNLYSLGYLDHKYVVMFFEVSFTGYQNIDSQNALMGTNITAGNEIVKRTIPIIIQELKCKVTAGGTQYTVRASVATVGVATSKDMFNFSKPIELDTGLTDFKKALQIIEDELNKAATENSFSEVMNSGLLPDNKMFIIDTSQVEDNPEINLNSINNSGENGGESAKYVIEPGTSIEKILDDITCSLKDNEKLEVTNEDKVVTADEFPHLYRLVPEIRYFGQVPSTKQKVMQMRYVVQKYWNTRLILSQPTDHEKQTQEMFKLIHKIGYDIDKKYDYIFTSKNSQILNIDINMDFLWWVDTYSNVALRNNDDTGMSISSTLDMHDKMSSSAGFRLENSNIGLSAHNLSNILKTENKLDMSLDLSNPQNQAMGKDDFRTTEDILAQIKDPKNKFSGYDACVIPATVPLSESNMSADVVNNSEVRAMSSFDQIYKTGDMIQLNLTIRGDPYWLCSPHIMNIQGDASFVFNMKTPAKRQTGVNEDLTIDYNEATTIWGVYNVLEITHHFKNGLFTQDLQAVANCNFRFPL